MTSPLTSPSYFVDHEPPLWIEGREVEAFLNRLLTVNVRQLSEGEGRAAHLLDAKGKLSASLYLLRLTSERWLAIPRTLSAGELAEKLDMYLFGEEVTLRVGEGLKSLRVISGLTELPEVLGALKLQLEPDSLAPVTTQERGWRLLIDASEGGGPLALQADRWARGSGLIELDIWGSEAKIKQLTETLEAVGVRRLADEAREALRLTLGAPDRPEYQGEYTPLDIEGSAPLISVSEGKGCYPGQEVIERTLALGQPARRLLHLRVVDEREVAQLSAARSGASLNIPLLSGEEGAQPLGVLTSVSPKGGPRFALAVVKRKQAERGAYFTAEGVKLTPARGEQGADDER